MLINGIYTNVNITYLEPCCRELLFLLFRSRIIGADQFMHVHVFALFLFAFTRVFYLFYSSMIYATRF